MIAQRQFQNGSTQSNYRIDNMPNLMGYTAEEMGKLADDVAFDKVVKSLVKSVSEVQPRGQRSERDNFSNSYNLSELGKEINEAYDPPISETGRDTSQLLKYNDE